MLGFRVASAWCHARNDLAAVSAIDAKVRVGRQDDRVGKRLAHPDEAGIGEAHRNVRVLLHETQDAIELVRQVEREDNRATAKKRTEGWLAPRPEKVAVRAAGKRERAARTNRSRTMSDLEQWRSRDSVSRSATTAAGRRTVSVFICRIVRRFCHRCKTRHPAEKEVTSSGPLSCRG